MSEEKYVKLMIERLTHDWGWKVMKISQKRRVLLRQHQSRKINTPSGLEFTFRHRVQDGDFRIFTKIKTGLIQWRTDEAMGDRLIYKPFNGTTFVERTPVEDLFMDPSDVDGGEVDLFCMMYPEISRLAKDFVDAMIFMDQELLTLEDKV